MSNPTKSVKPASRWGSLLSGAVAGIESRLDTILAEDGTVAARNAEVARRAASGSSAAREITSKTPSRSASSASRRPGQASASGDISTKGSSQVDNSPARPVTSTRSPRQSLELSTSQNNDGSGEGEAEQGKGLLEKDLDPNVNEVTSRSTNRAGTDAEDESSSRGREKAKTSVNGDGASVLAAPKTLDEFELELELARSDFERVELRRQDEAHDYLERIDALQAKLQYLTKETISVARKEVAEAGKEGLEKKLAEKDEQIALLMEEGQKLSKLEVAQAGAIRNLKASNAEEAKKLAESKRALARVEEKLADLRADKVQADTDRAEEGKKATRLAQLERETSQLRDDVASKEAIIQTLQKDIEDATRRVDEEEIRRNAETLQEEQKTSQSLREELEKLRSDHNTHRDKSKQDIADAQSNLQKEVERHQGVELNLRNEISTLENRLELLRNKSEEASSGATGDSQAKLLRQIETLQTQYSVASENWQGIQSSLQARVTALENERDESARQETEARRKARESGQASRRLQNQVDEATDRCQVLEKELGEHQERAEKVEERARDFERLLNEARTEFERERQDWNVQLAARLEEEKTKWHQQNQHNNAPPSMLSFGSPQAQSPQTTSQHRKISNLDLPALATRRSSGNRKHSELTLSGLTGLSSRPISRRNSTFPTNHSQKLSSDPPTMSPFPTESESEASITPNQHQLIPETPSFNYHEPDEIVETSSSPRRTVNDMLSVSTAGAGPSVQLVERMSASIRRLETEKAAAKDELARLSSQRDDARKEVVALMTEIEQKRALDAKVAKLEQELVDVKQRYQTTLEMLGEKSERVEELQADVADLKQIYRELVEAKTND